MAEMRVYRAPNGLTYQYPEGEQPRGYVLAKTEPKRRTKVNKAEKAANK